jgi:predicted MFS family arabinose efflux permease
MAGEHVWSEGAAAAEWRAHWKLPFVAMMGFALGTIAPVLAGPFMAPLEEAFGWSRATVSSGIMLYSLASVFCQWFVGRLIDRWGPRRIGLIGILLSGCAFSAFATADGSTGGWILLWLAYSLASQFALMPVWSAAVASEFDAGRGLALAVTLSGSSVVNIFGPLIATLVIASYGWRTAYLILGGVPTIVTLLLAWFFFYSKRDRLARNGAAPEHDQETGLLASEGFRSPVFYKLTIATFTGFCVVTALGIHLMPILTSSGLSREQAAIVLGVFGIIGIMGKLICGVLVNYVPGQIITAGLTVLPIGGCLMLMAPSDSVLMRIIAITPVALTSGGQVKMLAYMTSRHFGLRAFGAIFGVVSIAISLSAGVGPLLAGFLYDLTKSYDTTLLFAIPVCLVSGAVMLWIGGYPKTPEESPDAELATA